MSIKKCVVWSFFFEPPQEFKELIEKLGYEFIPSAEVSEVNFDPRIVKYVETHSNWRAWNSERSSMMGAPSSRFKIGFAGTATIIEVDTSKPWTIGYTGEDEPYPKYLKMITNKFNQVSVYWTREAE